MWWRVAQIRAMDMDLVVYQTFAHVIRNGMVVQRTAQLVRRFHAIGRAILLSFIHCAYQTLYRRMPVWNSMG